MRLVDANVLLYAVNEDALHHSASRSWLDRALGGSDTVGLAWACLLAFVRLATRPGLFPDPLTPAEAFEQVDAWCRAPGAVVVHPGPDHAAHVSELLQTVGVGANLVNDAHLAALALEQRGDVVSYDNDFDRFSGVRWRRPDQL